ncbi:MAG: hypothetical protein U9N06_01370 [candidate division WOR-3 bacterium]|nr:hypothetical protein [candidate division WOR-3 bacterium]
MRKFVLYLTVFGIFLISCGGEETFAGMAHRLRAEYGLKEIRNALAKYEIKNNKYPDEENWQEVLKPYFKKERFPEPQWITKRKMFVMVAKNHITLAEGIMKELERKLFYADSSLQAKMTEYLLPIDSSLTFAGYEIKEAREYEYRNIVPELKGLYNFVQSLNLADEKKDVISQMEQEEKELATQLEQVKGDLLVRDSIMGGNVIDEDIVRELFNLIEEFLEKPLLEVKGESAPSGDTIPLYSEAVKNQVSEQITSLDSKKDSLLIKELKGLDKDLSSYTFRKNTIDFLDYLNELKKKLPASIKHFDIFYKEREEVRDANKILNGYSALANLRALVKLYEDQNDSLPKGNLYDIFKEEESMKEIRKDIASDPYLELVENGYKLKSIADNRDQTPLVLDVDFVNIYKDLVSGSFNAGPFYETDDSNSTYFVWIKAKDKEKTIVTIRPKLKEER